MTCCPRSHRILLALPLGLFILAQFAHAASVDLSSFIRELDRMHAPTRMVRQAATHVNGLRWDYLPPGGAAAYNRTNGEILLDSTFRDTATAGLKDARTLTSNQISTLYHELFHCYFQKVTEAKQDDFYRFFAYQAERLYPSHALEIHEEATALFLEAVLGQYVTTFRILETKTPQGRQRFRAHAPFVQLYERSFHEGVYGYYRNFWGQIISAEVSLPEDDRRNALTRILDGELPLTFKEAFSENRFSPPLRMLDEQLNQKVGTTP